MASLNSNNQKIILCGVGAHYQNVIVEIRIRNITKIARPILLHHKRYQPECVETMFWLFAVKVEIEILNFLQLGLDGNTATANFCNIKNIKKNAHEYHTFGFPVYVLNSKLQLGSIGPPKWDPCSRVSVYLDHSPMHARYVAVILNPVTGHVSPQYHVVYDETLFTVSHMRDETIPPTWDKMCKKRMVSNQ